MWRPFPAICISHCVIQVVDTRPKGRYDGTAPEPNPKIRSGHMHGSISFPFTNIIDSQTKTMKDVDAIKQGVWPQLYVDDGGYGQTYCHACR